MIDPTSTSPAPPRSLGLHARYPNPPEGSDRAQALAYMHTKADAKTVSRDWASFNIDGEEEKRKGGHLTFAEWIR